MITVLFFLVIQHALLIHIHVSEQRHPTIFKNDIVILINNNEEVMAGDLFCLVGFKSLYSYPI